MIKFDPLRSELAKAIWGQRKSFYSVGLFTCIFNLLLLAPALYMLQVYDRVLSSRNEMTLLMLSVLLLVAYMLTAGLEWSRTRLLLRVSMCLDEALHDRVFSAAFEANLKQSPVTASQALSDLTAVRQFVSGSGILALADAPWGIVFLIVIFIMHWALGVVALVGAVLLFSLAYLNEKIMSKPLAEANQCWGQTLTLANNSLRNAEVIGAMGMLEGLRQRWLKKHREVLGLQAQTSDRTSNISALTKFLRLVLQSAALGVGALLVLDGSLSSGSMVTASIIMGRVLSPVELAIATWKGFLNTRTSWERLDRLLSSFPMRKESMPLPAPLGRVSVEALTINAPGGMIPILKNISFGLEKGQMLMVIGPSAAGKSSLARALVGIWPAVGGKVRLDGADISSWDRSALGPNIGYLPQDIELFDGTVAENIARFGEVDSDRVIEAASAAGLHELILRFPQGYDTKIGEGGGFLSAGQRQRIGLARALYGRPVFVVLDEPNSNLDEAGDAALVSALANLKEQGTTCVVVTHRTNVLALADQLLVLKDGQVVVTGPRDEVLQAMREAGAAAVVAPQVRAVPASQSSAA